MQRTLPDPAENATQRLVRPRLAGWLFPELTWHHCATVGLKFYVFYLCIGPLILPLLFSQRPMDAFHAGMFLHGEGAVHEVALLLFLSP